MPRSAYELYKYQSLANSHYKDHLTSVITNFDYTLYVCWKPYSQSNEQLMLVLFISQRLRFLNCISLTVIYIYNGSLFNNLTEQQYSHLLESVSSEFNGVSLKLQDVLLVTIVMM